MCFVEQRHLVTAECSSSNRAAEAGRGQQITQLRNVRTCAYHQKYKEHTACSIAESLNTTNSDFYNCRLKFCYVTLLFCQLSMIAYQV